MSLPVRSPLVAPAPVDRASGYVAGGPVAELHQLIEQRIAVVPEQIVRLDTQISTISRAAGPLALAIAVALLVGAAVMR